MASQSLVEAIDLAKQGKKKDARLAFMAIIKEDPHEVMAYLWLVDLLESTEEQVSLLERCLLLNPDSQMARDAMEVILQQQTPELEDDYELPKASMAVYSKEKQPKPTFVLKKILKPVLIVIGLSVVVLLAIFGFRYLPDLFPTESIETEIADQPVAAATWTPLATPTATVTPTATPGLPVGFGTPAPPPAAMISAYDIAQLEVFSQWGSGIPFSAHWDENGDGVVVTSRSVDEISAISGTITNSFQPDAAIRAGDVCPAQNMAALYTADALLQWFSMEGILLDPQPETVDYNFRLLVFSPDCSYLAGVAEEDALVIWRVEDGEIHLQPGSIYGEINGLVFSTDGSRLALATDENITWLLETKTGEELARLVETTEGVDAVAFSGDGRLVAMASENDDYITVWNIEANHRQRTIATNRTGATTLAYGDNDQLLAVGYADGTILLRDEENREFLGNFSHYQSEIQYLEFDENGENLLSIGVDGSILTWKIDTSAGKTTFYPPIQGSIFTADITPNGKYLALAGSDSQIHFFDVAAQTEIASLRGHLGSVWYIDISADGNWLLSGGRDGTVRLWSLDSFEEEALLGEHGGYVRGVAFSPDGKYGVSASADEMVKVWDLEKLSELHTLVGHTDEVQYAFFTPDSAEIVSVGDDGTVRKWDRQSGRMLAVMEQDMAIPYLSGGFVGNDQILAGNEDGRVDLWDIEQQKFLFSFSRMKDEVISMDVTADGSLLATGAYNGDVVLWDVAVRDQIHFATHHSDPVVSVAFTATGREFFSVERNGTTVIWDMAALPVPQVLHHYQPQMQAAVLNETQGYAALAGVDGSVQVVDLNTGQISFSFKGDHAAVPDALAISPGGTHLAAAIEDGLALQVWDIATGETSFMLDEASRVTALLFEPGGRVLMTARSNHSIERRDIRSGAVLETMRGHSSPVQVMAFSPNEVTLASGAQDGMIFLWDMDDNSILQRINAHAGAITSLVFNPSGDLLYSTGTDGKLHVWRVSNGDLENTLATEAGTLSGLTLFDEQRLASAILSGDAIGFWTDAAIEIGEPTFGFYGDLLASAFSQDGSQLLIVDGDGTVQSLQIADSVAPSAEEIAAAMATPTAKPVEGSQEKPVIAEGQSNLPAPVYYLSDASGSAQVWRLETDGITASQITFENYPVTAFDVAQGTDHLAFVSNNDLFLTDKSGDSRWLIKDGETYPENSEEEAQRKAITNLHFSPDGWRLSYALNGVHVYSILNDDDTFLVENDNIGTESAVLYAPIAFSPGGNNLYIQVDDDQRLSLLVINSWTGEEYASFENGPCCQPQVNAEQDAMYFTGRDDWGNPVGLWLVDIWTDTLEVILPTTGTTASQINAWPIQDPLTNNLIFFYAAHERKTDIPLAMARAADDGTSLLQVIRAESFTGLREVLWAPDASLALISDPANQELTILFAEDRPAISLGIQGTMMRWGN